MRQEDIVRAALESVEPDAMTEPAAVTRWSGWLMGAAAAVFTIASLAWVFPREAVAVAGPRVLAASALSALLLSLGLVAQWRVLRWLVVVLAITLVLGWNPASVSSTSHFTGACLGFLVMLAIGTVARTPFRQTLAMLVFLGAGMVMLLVGLAGTPARTGTWLEAALPAAPPPIKLGLVGLDAGDVNANALAAAALVVVPLGVSVLVFLRRGQFGSWALRTLALAVVLTGALILAITQSITAWVAIWLMLVGALARGMRSWLARIVVGALVVAPVFAAGLSPLPVSQETYQRVAGEIWATVQARVGIMTEGWVSWRESPWLGIGVSEFRVAANQPPHRVVTHAHNMVLQTGLDVGVVGSLAYWGLLAFLLVRARQAARGQSRLARSAAVGSALCLVAVSLFGLGDAVPIGSKVGTFQWMASGLILAAWRTRSIAPGQGEYDPPGPVHLP